MKTWVYKHFKWKYYEVIWVAKNSETLEDFVVYKPLYELSDFWDVSFWIRPKNNFNELIEIDWKKIPRFEYVWK